MNFVGKMIIGTLVVMAMIYGSCSYMVSSKMGDVEDSMKAYNKSREGKSPSEMAAKAEYKVENCKTLFSGTDEFWCIKQVEQHNR